MIKKLFVYILKPSLSILKILWPLHFFFPQLPNCKALKLKANNTNFHAVQWRNKILLTTESLKF